jgi:LysM repeat protein
VQPLRPRPAPRDTSNELAKAQIVNTTTGTVTSVMFNPEELKLDQGTTFAEVPIPGLDTPPVQYVRGKPRTLSMELFFDTYEAGIDVRAYTAPIVALLDKLPQTQAPPVLLFSLGRVQLPCVLTEAGQRFTMFLRNGTPVRSTLSVRFQEYVRVEVELRQGLFFGSPTASAAVGAVTRAASGSADPSASVHVTVQGDTLSGLAGVYLGDPARWREIADLNAIGDPLALPPGTPLLLPGGPRGARR